jgi:hypothetical protein
MAHTCNPSYLGGWDWEDWGLRPALGEKSLWDPISVEKEKKLGMEVYTCHPGDVGNVNLGGLQSKYVICITTMKSLSLCTINMHQ